MNKIWITFDTDQRCPFDKWIWFRPSIWGHSTSGYPSQCKSSYSSLLPSSRFYSTCDHWARQRPNVCSCRKEGQPDYCLNGGNGLDKKSFLEHENVTWYGMRLTSITCVWICHRLNLSSYIWIGHHLTWPKHLIDSNIVTDLDLANLTILNRNFLQLSLRNLFLCLNLHISIWICHCLNLPNHPNLWLP